MSTTVVESLPNLLPGMLPRLWAFALRLCSNRHDAEDLLQRSCVRGLERAHQLQAGTAPLSWMFSIMHATWTSELQARSVQERASVDWDDTLLTVSDPAARSPEDVQWSREIIATVARLPEAQRVAMLLVAVEGLNYAEAARVLDVSIGTIMSRLSHARQSIGERFRDQLASAMRSAAAPAGTRTPAPHASRYCSRSSANSAASTGDTCRRDG